MDEALCAILCSPESWTWEPFLSYSIKFNSDGTGELFCIQELTYLFALNLKWRLFSLSPRNAVSVPPYASIWRTKPETLGTFRLEITLTRDLASGLRAPDPAICAQCHESYLLDTAYLPKVFTVTLQKGNFLPASRAGHEDKTYILRYGLRLLFDRSPFPSYEEFNKTIKVPPVGPADRNQPPMLEFVARELPRSERRGTAMNDVSAESTWGCVMS